MKKQQKTYFLLAGVLAIWGIIGYQIFNQLNTEEITISVNNDNFKYIPKERIEVKKYNIKGNYRDPFLGKSFFNKKKKVKSLNVKEKKLLPFPNVVYNGIIQGSKKKSYIITVNGKQEIIKINQTFQNITLLQANNKEIKVRFNNIIKKIPKL
ncbi:hypothetical protein [uncultured Tenacibaculum sp.]|uniref:hypothetical protein n=1 Tax=uncultured Tenacibaculum sp. TaxID=174713 RepID=UPI0026242C69|nr:hypothetical protein [uncultured Tenacibaculum sp.]